MPPKIDPSDFTPADGPTANAGSNKIDPGDFTPAAGPSSLPPDASSVFSRPRTTGEQAVRLGRQAINLGVGVGVPMAASAMLGPEASAPAKIAAQGIAGAVAPYAEYGVAKLLGEDVQRPSYKDAIKSAAFNAGLTSVGEGIAALGGKAAAVGPEMEAFPGPQSRQTIKQAVRNRDFWKRQGLSDPDIDDILKSPGEQARLAQQIAAGDRYKQSFQTVLDHTRQGFKDRYGAIFAPAKDTKIDVAPLGQQFEAIAQGEGQHEITPSFRAFLQRKALELTKAGEATGPSIGGTPWKQLPESLKAKIREQGLAQGIKTPSNELNPEELQQLRTELRENVPAGATNLDRQVAHQLNDQITQMMEEPLSPEARGALHGLDAEYGRFQDAIQTLDPRSARYGHDVANLLFDPMVKNPGDALNFINLAKQAEAARPGEVMPQLREAFNARALEVARTPGQPFEELRALRKLQNQWGTDKNLRSVMGALYGKNSPLADPATFTKVLGVADNPKAVIDAIGSQSGKFRSILSSPYMQAYALFGLGVAASGAKGGGLWSSLSGQKGPEAAAIAVASMLAGPLVVGKVMSSGNAALQRRMVDFMTKPDAGSMIKYMGSLAGATGGGLISLPGQKDTSAQP